jgi:hypothetical protein
MARYCEECGEPINSPDQRCWETGATCYSEQPEAKGRKASGKTCTYKGRQYRLAWKGRTKYGKRAKLEYFDGSKTFWVDATKIG